MIRIADSRIGVEREPLASPLGFKGGHLRELWQIAVWARSASGHEGLGLATQSTLWSDAGLFLSCDEGAGNEFMRRMTVRALELAGDIPFANPMDLIGHLVEPTWAYGKEITGRGDLRMTFALNALVALDNAAWQLYAAEQGAGTFDAMVPAPYRAALGHRQGALAAIPLISYGVPVRDIIEAVENGCFFLKIKIGSDPDADGDQEKMLAWDSRRLSEIHEALKDRATPHTGDGRIPYYLDANGRYQTREHLERFLDHAEKIGALERILILEEPFPEDYRVDVSDLPVRLAADESAHSDADAIARMDEGYGAIALKPIAKTLSMSLRIAQRALERGVPCFCADLTVNPILVDWNKNVAARLSPLPGMTLGVLESNGHQNYRNWELMKTYHPRPSAAWTEVRDGVFPLDEDFYACSGGIFEKSAHYLAVAGAKT